MNRKHHGKHGSSENHDTIGNGSSGHGFWRTLLGRKKRTKKNRGTEQRLEEARGRITESDRRVSEQLECLRELFGGIETESRERVRKMQGDRERNLVEAEQCDKRHDSPGFYSIQSPEPVPTEIYDCRALRQIRESQREKRKTVRKTERKFGEYIECCKESASEDFGKNWEEITGVYAIDTEQTPAITDAIKKRRDEAEARKSWASIMRGILEKLEKLEQQA
jgi:hypothetical protein